MEIGIIGLPVSGKTTLFSTLTQQEVDQFSGKKDTHKGVIKVPDERLNILTEIFNPRKQVNATVDYIEVPGMAKDAAKSGFNTEFLNNLKNTDAILAVIRDFNNEIFPHPDNSIDPVRDIDTIDSEMLFSDLEVVENRAERLRKQLQKQKSPEGERELALIEKCKNILEEEKPLRTVEFHPDESKKLKGFQFLTLKPIIYAINVDEKRVPNEEEYLLKYNYILQRPKSSVVMFSGQIEHEISQLSDDDREMFLEDMGIKEAALPKLIRTSYELLGLISFFTVGEDECRAWTIRHLTTAQNAAGVIHSDLERGFIRAEIINYDEFIKYKKLSKCKEAGVLRLEGKEYVVQDGDIISVRFNV